MKLYLLAVILSVMSFATMADFTVGGGYSDPFWQGDKGTVLRLGWEQSDKKYPWLVHVDYFEGHGTGDNYTDSHVTLSGGKRILKFEKSGWAFYADFGLSAISKRSAANSAHWSFFQEAGISKSGISVYIKHTSNAGFSEPNKGENTLGIRYTF